MPLLPATCSTLHLTNAYHPTSGGVRRFYRALLDAAARTGRRLTLVVPGAADHVARLSATTSIYTVRAPRAPAVDRRYRVILPHRYLFRRDGPVRAILRDLRPDVVEVNDKFSLCYLAGLLRKGWWPDVPRPVLVGHSSERVDDGLTQHVAQGRTMRAFCRWYVQRIYVPLFDYHVANSAYTAAELLDGLPAWRTGHVHVLPMGIDTTCFRPGRRDESLRRALLARLGADEHAVLLAYAGRLSREKGVVSLVEMLRLLAGADRDYRLVLVGDGPLRPWIERQALTLRRPRVLLWGHVESSAALARIVASADIFVHPNAREPFGIGPLEAMATGTRVVVPAAGGVLSYASEANAWLAGPGAPGLAAAVERAARRDPDGSAKLAAARRQALTFDWPSVTARWFRLYDHLHQRGTLEWSTAGFVSRPLPMPALVDPLSDKASGMPPAS